MAVESERSGRGRAIGIGAAALTIVVVAVIAVVLLSRPADPVADGATGQTAGSSAATSPTASAPESPPSAEPTSSATVERVAGWHGGPISGPDGSTDRALSVTRGADGFVAVGVHFPDGPPYLAAVPQEGRVWLSPDGRTWEDVTPPDTFADTLLGRIFPTADGALIALGSVAEAAAPNAAWESTDGRTWRPTSVGLPADRAVSLVVGARGYLALLVATDGHEVWLSADGRAWELVRAASSDESLLATGAGDDGFVVIGTRGDAESAQTFAVASSDGRQWIEATAPPEGAAAVVSQGGDWIASGSTGLDILGVRNPSGCMAEPPEERVWSSSNGLEWTEVGTIPPMAATIPAECWYVNARLLAAAGWLISSTRASPGPCCDIILMPDAQRISADGRTWETLPFPAADREAGRLGSSVNGAVTDGDMLILVGHSGNRAAFWFNEAP